MTTLTVAVTESRLSQSQLEPGPAVDKTLCS